MKRTRRNHGAAFKTQVALAACKGDKTLAGLAEQFGVHSTQITEWKRHLLERVTDVFGGTAHKPDALDLKILHAKIGQLALENDFLEGALTKAELLSAKAMIDRTHALPVVRQCQLLALSRSTAYYQPTRVSAADLALMRRIDALHLAHPFAGARMLRDLLRQEGHSIGRRHVSTLMTRMDIEAVYRKPHTSQRHPAHKVYPYLLRQLEITSESRLGGGHHLHPDAARLRVFVRGPRLGQSPRAGVAAVQHSDQQRPHRALDGKTPDQVYCDHLTTRLTAA